MFIGYLYDFLCVLDAPESGCLPCRCQVLFKLSVHYSHQAILYHLHLVRCQLTKRMLYINHSYTEMTCSYLPVAMFLEVVSCLLILVCFCATGGVEVEDGILFVACSLPLGFIPEEYGPGFDWSTFATYACEQTVLRFFTQVPHIRFLLGDCNPTVAGFSA